MDLKQETIDTYNASAKALADKLDKSGARVDDVARLFSFVEVENPRVLEIGCAQGRDVAEILKYTNSYRGIDISSEMLALARKKYSDILFEEADVESYEFSGGLDVVIAFASLIHTPQDLMSGVLRKIYDSLQIGGVLYTSMKRAETYQEYVREESYGVRTYYLYNRNLLKRLAGDGWKVVYERDYNWRGVDWFDVIFKKHE